MHLGTPSFEPLILFCLFCGDSCGNRANSVQELQGVTQIQQAIMTNGPVEAAFSVYSDFMQYQSGVYQHTSGVFLGGHAVKVLRFSLPACRAA
jgi:hypothetical protein